MEVAGIRNRAVLIKANVSCWEGKKLDRRLGRETAREKGAQKDDAVSTTKKLLWAKELDDIIKMRNRIRQYVDDNTVAWMSRGPRLLASTQLMEFMAGWTELKDQYERLAGALSDVYQTRREESMTLQGSSLASLSDYPASLEGLFECSLDIMPIPDISDIRLDLDEENVQKVQKQMEERFNAMFTNSISDVWSRIEGVMQALVDKMKTYKTEEGVRSKMHDSILGNICQLVALLPGFNITKDAELDEMMERMNKSFCSIAVDTLKQDALLRQDIAAEASRVLDIARNRASR